LSIENSLRYRQAEDNATIDYLTGLPNGRSLFLHVEQEIARCRRSGEALAVLVCDLDGFKQVNDRFGHLEGNRILKKVAGILRQSCRRGDYVARMGGDEFVIVMAAIRPEDVQQFAERTRQAICRIGVEDYDEPLLNASIGCAELTPDVTQAEQLLSHADRLMYAVKRRHKECQSGADLVGATNPHPQRMLLQ
jgi:diguanylate cyclase (GGDEF)-like protein